jgi:hypothetical protein
MDDVWFYDLNGHRWICCYPGTKACGGSLATKSTAAALTGSVEEL